VVYQLSQSLAAAFPDRHLLETEEGAFDVARYQHGGQCEIHRHVDVHSEYGTKYNGRSQTWWEEPYNAWLTVEWRGERFDVITLTQMGEFRKERHHFVLGPSSVSARKFFVEVCRWNSEVRGEVLVFAGCWTKDTELYQAIEAATLANLVLEGDQKEILRDDVLRFFDSKETYERYGIPWKRGVLLLGPPGNGKTHAIKGLINLVGRPCLYVKSFKSPQITDHDCIRQVFERARNTAPCVLVLEDLDSLLDDGNRAYFLNELDGFATNTGILTIATTNHPERLDPAILERPSRFDRKYTFHLPALAGRREYLRLTSEGLEPALRLSDEEIEKIAEASEGFSYAYLKELFLSSMMAWMAAPGAGMAQTMLGQVEALRAQMVTNPEPTPPVMPAARPAARWKK